ncbi:MAG: hypothetical protein WC692_07520 [Erythrobacter sp.]|jgi:hypothetical protein
MSGAEHTPGHWVAECEEGSFGGVDANDGRELARLFDKRGNFPQREVTRFLALYREAARELDASCGPGTARSEAIGMVITLGLAAIVAIGLAAITGDA